MHKLCFLPDLFETGFAGRRVEGSIAAGGVATSAGDTSVELDDPLDNPSLNGWFPHVARGRSHLVLASGRPELWFGVRLLARLQPQRQCG